MVNWIRVISEQFSIGYLLLALYCKEDLRMIGMFLSSYNYDFWDNPDYVSDLVVDCISHCKINVFGDE